MKKRLEEIDKKHEEFKISLESEKLNIKKHRDFLDNTLNFLEDITTKKVINFHNYFFKKKIGATKIHIFI